MNPSADSAPVWLPWLIGVGFPFFFGALWCGVCLLLSGLGGWGRLAEKFAALRPPAGTRFFMQSGKVGVVNYKGCLTVHTSADGLHLAVWPFFRIGHKPLLIPWRDIHNGQVRSVLFSESVAFEVGSPKIATLRLSKKIFAGQPVVL